VILLADRHLPTLVTSLPRHHACYVDCGEDHSAILTKVQCSGKLLFALMSVDLT
jgi:hypothetical protein